MTFLSLPPLCDGEDKHCPFKNRLRKNYQHLRKWAKRTQTNAFRLYDRDIKEHPYAIDFYGGKFCVHYFAPPWEQEELPHERVALVTSTLQALFAVPENALFWRTRIKREKLEQYEKADTLGSLMTVYEYGVPFLVNLSDYLDTGLFLDHRETRQKVAKCSSGKRVLNLFAYTCSFSVHAALAGARSTTSVDLSNTYTDWGRKNFALNGIDPAQHQILRADCLKFLKEDAKYYDLIVLDPPTLSRSKKMDQLFEIQEDYVALLEQALARLAPEGILFFSTNSRRFRFDPIRFPQWDCIEISAQTVPMDFHDRHIHRCWQISSLGTTSCKGRRAIPV